MNLSKIVGLLKGLGYYDEWDFLCKLEEKMEKENEKLTVKRCDNADFLPENRLHKVKEIMCVSGNSLLDSKNAVDDSIKLCKELSNSEITKRLWNIITTLRETNYDKGQIISILNVFLDSYMEK